MNVVAYAGRGFSGRIVSVEVDIRRGIPGMDIVGLPDGAVREARERVRIALRRSGYTVPRERLLVNLAPADVRKEGASYDLPIALGILLASGQVDGSGKDGLLCAGELMLTGVVRPVAGILSAVAAARAAGTRRFLVPAGNVPEASALGEGTVYGIDHLRQLQPLCRSLARGDPPAGDPGDSPAPITQEVAVDTRSDGGDLADLMGQPVLRRAVEITAAGRHHLLLFGPPGSGKTMSARMVPGLLPDLDRDGSLEVTRIHSQAGYAVPDEGLIRRPPFREPHHSASVEGVIGGGGTERPGEASLAHRGILFLDEAPEFNVRILQALREPLESRRVDVARADRGWWYPADFQLILATNPCPCGNLGREESHCVCSRPEVYRYWKKMGGALLDRIDVRVPVRPVDPLGLLSEPGESSRIVRDRVADARERQARRFKVDSSSDNAHIAPGRISRFVRMDGDTETLYVDAARKLGLSSRACHGVLKVALTISDLAGRDRVEEEHLLEALQHRRYGDRDVFWLDLRG